MVGSPGFKKAAEPTTMGNKSVSCFPLWFLPQLLLEFLP